MKNLQIFEIVSSYDKWEWQKDLIKQTMARSVSQPEKRNTAATSDSLCPLKEHSHPVFKVQESHYCSCWLRDQLTGSGATMRQQALTANNCTSNYSGIDTGNTCSFVFFLKSATIPQCWKHLPNSSPRQEGISRLPHLTTFIKYSLFC